MTTLEAYKSIGKETIFKLNSARLQSGMYAPNVDTVTAAGSMPIATLMGNASVGILTEHTFFVCFERVEYVMAWDVTCCSIVFDPRIGNILS